MRWPRAITVWLGFTVLCFGTAAVLAAVVLADLRRTVTIVVITIPVITMLALLRKSDGLRAADQRRLMVLGAQSAAAWSMGFGLDLLWPAKAG